MIRISLFFMLMSIGVCAPLLAQQAPENPIPPHATQPPLPSRSGHAQGRAGEQYEGMQGRRPPQRYAQNPHCQGAHAPNHSNHRRQPYNTALHAPHMRGNAALHNPRIRKGVAAGTITRPELRRLSHQQVQLKRDRKIASLDGQISPEERRFIHQEQRRYQQNIRRSAHNRQHMRRF